MLIRFGVSNLLSFKEQVNLELVASGERIHPHHVYRTKTRSDPNVLRVAAIYGPNAAGKSNLVKAVALLKRLVVEGTEARAKIGVSRFRLDPECLRQPARFEIELRTDGVNYRYVVAVNPDAVQFEQLSTITNLATEPVFTRTVEAGKVAVSFGRTVQRQSRKQREFLEFVALATRPNQLFLHEAEDKNVGEFAPVCTWFRESLTIIQPESKLALDVKNGMDQGYRAFLGRLLRAADTGVSGVDLQELSREAINALPSDVLRSLAEQMAESTTVGRISTEQGEQIIATRQGDEVRFLKLLAVHRLRGSDETTTLDMSQESDGTRRLLDLAPILYSLQANATPRVYVVDELDRSLHPHVTNMLLDLHLAETNASVASQLIFTTHESHLLNLERLRRDEIWFVEKQADGASSLYPMSDFQPRYDKDVRRDYLVGRYGAIPYVGGAQSLTNYTTEAAPRVLRERREDDAE